MRTEDLCRYFSYCSKPLIAFASQTRPTRAKYAFIRRCFSSSHPLGNEIEMLIHKRSNPRCFYKFWVHTVRTCSSEKARCRIMNGSFAETTDSCHHVPEACQWIISPRSRKDQMHCFVRSRTVVVPNPARSSLLQCLASQFNVVMIH
jgi:hypothetical protein